MSYEGTIGIHIHKEKGLMLVKGEKDSYLTANDADEILRASMEAATKHGVTFEPYSFYIPGVNEKLEKAGKPLTVKHLEDAVKAGLKPVVIRGGWGKPKLLIAIEREPKKRESKIIKIA